MPCHLCNQIRPLRDSHILPEFVYRPTYDVNHTAIALDVTQGTRRKRQKGFTQRLLCAACEQHFSNWESYFARIWLHPKHSIRPKTLATSIVEIKGLDYTKFKLFHMSLVWRASIATSQEFKNISLRTRSEAMRQRLLNADPGGPDDFPLFGLALRDPQTGGFQDKIVKGFTASRVDGQWVLVTIFGGVMWHYYTSGNATTSTPPINFDPSGILTLGVQNWTDNPAITEFATKLPTTPSQPKAS